MKVQHVSLSASPEAANCITLTPELMAACGARYSRSDEGIEVISNRVDWDNPGKSVDSIFKMADYGHVSIYDMAPVALFMDGISLLAAFWLWHFCPRASGQESSTRYIRFNDTKMCKGSDIGISDIESSQHSAFLCYDKADIEWSFLAKRYPSVMRIPKKDIGEKQVTRMRRNYAFDRARVFLPLSSRTNVMMIQSGRDWVDLVSILLSSPLVELQGLGREIIEALKHCIPRMLKHAVIKESNKVLWENRANAAKNSSKEYKILFSSHSASSEIYGDLSAINKKVFSSRANRYCGFEDAVRTCMIDMSWKQGSFGELRDLNRHRTGSKVLGVSPNGFMPAADQHQDMADLVLGMAKGPMKENFERCWHSLSRGDLSGYYHLSLGHTFPWRQVTTLDKAVYTIELRTGLGAHYAYARMMQELVAGNSDLAALMKLGHMGTAEPE